MPKPYSYFLGRCEFSSGDTFARLQPVLEGENGCWTCQVAKEDFPDEGLAFAYEGSVRTAESDSMWVFSVEENPNYDSSQRRDRFTARKPTPAIELVDSLQLRDERAIRDAVLRKGLPLRSRPYAAVLVAIGNGKWIEIPKLKKLPSKLDLSSKLGYWVADEQANSNMLAELKVHILNIDQIVGLKTPDGRMFLHPAKELTGFSEICNWEDDDRFLGRVFSRLKKLGQKGKRVRSIDITERVFDDAIKILAAAEVMPQQKPIDEATCRRIKEFKSELLQENNVVATIINVLSEVDGIRERLHDELGPEREKLLTAARQEIEISVQSERNELRNLREQVVRARSDLNKITGEIARTRTLLEKESKDLLAAAREEAERATQSERDELCSVREQIVGARSELKEIVGKIGQAHTLLAKEVVSFDTELDEMLTRTLEKPSRAVAEALLRDAISMRVSVLASPSRSQVMGTSISTRRGIDIPTVSKAEVLESPHALGVALDNLSDCTTLNRRLLQTVDALARAREIPLLIGQDADWVVHAYAQVVAGGIVESVPLGPTTITFDDLFASPVGRAPTALTRAVERALDEPNRCVLVSLSGLETSPAGYWLPALKFALQSWHDRGLPKNLLIIATATADADRIPLTMRALRCVIPLSVKMAADIGDPNVQLRSPLQLFSGRRSPTVAVSYLIATGERIEEKALAVQKLGDRYREIGDGSLESWFRTRAVFQAGADTLDEIIATQMALEVSAYLKDAISDVYPMDYLGETRRLARLIAGSVV